MDAAGRHSGGPFRVDVTPKLRVLDLRRIVQVRPWALLPDPRFLIGSTGGIAMAKLGNMALHRARQWHGTEPGKAACWLCMINSRPLSAQVSGYIIGQRSRFHGVGAQRKSGIPCGLQRLSYAGKHMDDSQRTLEQCAAIYPAHTRL